MPVEKPPGRKGYRQLVCDKCGTRSDLIKTGTIAAADLDACEQMEGEGWAYDIGFYSMMLGHTVLCPACASRKEPT